MINKRNLKKNQRAINTTKITGIVASVILGVFLGIYQFLPQIKSALAGATTKKEAQQSADISKPKAQESFNVSDISNSSVSVVTSSNSNVAVNSTIVSNTNNIANTNNKINQKIENNFQQNSQTINNYGDSTLQQTNANPQRPILPKQETKVPPQVSRQQPTTQGSIKDPNIENYLALLQQHRDRGASLAKCNSVRLCLKLYNEWQDQGNNLLRGIDNYIQQKYQRRSELQQEFGNEPLSQQIFPETPESLGNIQSIFFSRAKFFGMMDIHLKGELV